MSEFSSQSDGDFRDAKSKSRKDEDKLGLISCFCETKN